MPSLIPTIFVAFISSLSGSAISTLIKFCCIFQTIARHLLHQHQSTNSRFCMRGVLQLQYWDRLLLPHTFSLLIMIIDFEKYCWLLSADFDAPCHSYIVCNRAPKTPYAVPISPPMLTHAIIHIHNIKPAWNYHTSPQIPSTTPMSPHQANYVLLLVGARRHRHINRRRTTNRVPAAGKITSGR